MLEAEPTNAHALARALPMSKRWAHEYLKHLHSLKQIHIARWDKEIGEREKRHAIEVWAAGAGEDAPRPPADGSNARYKRAWNAVKADEERHDRLKATRRVRRRIKSGKPEIASAWISNVFSARASQL